jgi:hypothetical protein
VSHPIATLLSPSVAAGFVVFRPGEIEKSIDIPIERTGVPQTAQYRLGIDFQGLYNALIEHQPGEVALLIFGVRPGTYPPGREVSKPGAFVASSSNAAIQWWQSVASTPGGISIAGLSIAIAIYTNGSEIPVSSRRQPTANPSGLPNTTSTALINNTMELAGMLPPVSGNITLCVLPTAGTEAGALSRNTSFSVRAALPAQILNTPLSPHLNVTVSKFVNQSNASAINSFGTDATVYDTFASSACLAAGRLP